MNIKKFNWQLLAAFLISIVALLSYPFFFVRWPITRDFPWASLLLFGIAFLLLIVGLRRAFAPDRSRLSKAAGISATVLTTAVLVVFVFSIFILARQLPASSGAPQVGQKAPDFTLTDANGQTVSLADLRAPQSGNAKNGVLLIFYRGYW
jgi:hypothetical protein